MIPPSSSPSSARTKKGFRMENKSSFGLIGRTLKHSYSQKIHNLLRDYSYNLFELEKDQLQEFLDKKEVKGFNVTIPYKEQIIPYLYEVEGVAKDIGAVNTVVFRDDKLFGYNTDFLGMTYMLKKADISLKDKTVMLLGSGGTSKTATAVANHLGAKEIIKVSRSGEINYQNCYDFDNTQIIINTTPVGMFPNNYDTPIDLEKFPLLEGVVDVIYNPSKTMLSFKAKELGLKHTNALYMLVGQAKYASEIFTDVKIDDSEIDRITKVLEKENQNVVLIGMPSSGKSTVGKILAKKLGKEFIDTDSEIEKREKEDIPTIFSKKGEEYFREVEREVLKEVGKLTGKVIATGGGVVKDLRNKYPLSANGVIVYLERDLDKLLTEGRPLSKSREDIERLYNERKDKYRAFAEFSVDNNGNIQDTVKGVMELL